MSKENLIYTIIYHPLRLEFGLTANQAIIAEAIDVMSHNRKYDGWCVNSKENIGKAVGISRRSVISAINLLIELGLIERDDTGNNIRTTDLYISKKHYYKQQIENTSIATDQDQGSGKEYKNNYVQFVDLWNETYGTKLRITDGKRTQIKARLESFTEDEIKLSIANRSKDSFLNGEGKKYLTSWNSFWRNDEKVERYLNQEQPKKTNYIAI